MSKEYYELAHHIIKLEPLSTEGWILDIGGGGEGVIGELMGKQVVAIDLRKDELEETHNDSMKIVMDATELKFLDESFPMVTAYYALMYMPVEVQEKVFTEVFRVLEPGGHFLLWDAKIPTKPDTDLDVVVITQTIELPDKTIQTGYGCRWPEKELTLEHYSNLGRKQGLTVSQQVDSEGKLYIKFKK